MPEFLNSSEMNSTLEKIISGARKILFLISPYIKLHERLKAELKAKLQAHELNIVVVFGKNEDDITKSINKEDLLFFAQFPNVELRYEKNLHAKFYASEECALLTSMNLHSFSQNTNVEAGILMFPKTALGQIADLVNDSDIYNKSMSYFDEVIDRSEIIFEAKPVFKKEFLGLSKSYVSSEVKINKIEDFTGKTKNMTYGQNSGSEYISRKDKPNYRGSNNYQRNSAYCIRTGTPIPYNTDMPFCAEAFNTWVQFENPDFPEAFCHSTGKPSYGKTSMRHPVL